MEPMNLLPMQKKLFDTVKELISEGLAQERTWTVEELVNELKTNRKYVHYNRQPDKILRAMIKKLFPQFNEIQEMKDENGQIANPYLKKLNNRKLIKDKKEETEQPKADDMTELIEDELKSKKKIKNNLKKS